MNAGRAPATDRDLAARFTEVREFTELLAAPLSAEDQTIQSMTDVSPTKWHRAHTTWFFETFVLQPHVAGYRSFDDSFVYLFNSYYEAVGDRWPRDRRGLVSRPGIDTIARYRAHVDAAMRTFVAHNASPEVDALVTLGLHHEQQHQELLLMDIKHVLATQYGSPAYRTPTAPEERTASKGDPVTGASWLRHPGGLLETGHHGEGFAFDNESPRHHVWVEAFEIGSSLVTCGEWKAFIDDGGYTTPALWLSDGWSHAQRHGWCAPEYWSMHDDGWQIDTLTGRRVVRDEEPVVHVSSFEADAFARWAGARLPSEVEWEICAHDRSESDAARSFGLHPVATADNWFGAVWQWTSSVYLPYPRYVPSPGAIGEYNGKFMSGQMVLRGSACITPVGHSRSTYRNFFPPAARWMFAGLRLARSTPS